MYSTNSHNKEITDNLCSELQVVRLKDAADSFIAGEYNAFEHAGLDWVALWLKTSSISQMEIFFQSIIRYLIMKSNNALESSNDRLKNPAICSDFLDIILEHKKFRVIEREILKKHFLNCEGKMTSCYGKLKVFTGIIILMRDNGYFKKSILDQKVTCKTIASYVKRQYGIDISNQLYRNKELSELALKQFPILKEFGLTNKLN